MLADEPLQNAAARTTETDDSDVRVVLFRSSWKFDHDGKNTALLPT